jgi:hypothetical protein
MVIKKTDKALGIVAHTCNRSTWEVEAEESQVQIQLGLHSFLFSL